MSRRLLQITNAVFALLTITLAGTSLLLGVDNPIYLVALPLDPSLDSNLRFMGGMGLGLGLALLWILPTIESQAALFRLIWLCAFLGGLGRLISTLAIGAPQAAMLVFAVIEVIAAPLLIYWQMRVANSTTTAGSVN